MNGKYLRLQEVQRLKIYLEFFDKSEKNQETLCCATYDGLGCRVEEDFIFYSLYYCSGILSMK